MAEYEYTIGDNESADYIIKMEKLTVSAKHQKTFFLKHLFANANLSEELLSEEEIKKVVVRIIWTKHREDGLKLPFDKGEELINMLVSRHPKNKRTVKYDLMSI